MTFGANDRIYETSITTGSGTYTLAGAASGFQAFNTLGTIDCPYFATDDTNWEVGIGTILSGPDRLQRTKIYASSNAGLAINWGAGTRKIRCGLPAIMAFFRAVSKSVAGSADVPLTTDEQRLNAIILTGILTGNINVTVDATPWEWTVLNSTTGAFTLTFKTTGGTGVVVKPGVSTKLRCDGVNIVASVTLVPQRAVAVADGTTFTPTGDTAEINYQPNTQAAGNLTMAAPTGTPTHGQTLTLRIKSTNVQTFVWNAIYRGSKDHVLPQTSTGASATDYLQFIYNATDAKWDCVESFMNSMVMADANNFTPTVDAAEINYQANTQSIGTLTANAPTGTPFSGQKLRIRIKSTNIQTFAWNAIYRASRSNPLPTVSTGASATDYLDFVYNATDTKWDCVKSYTSALQMADATAFTPIVDGVDFAFQVNTQSIGTLTANAPTGTPFNGQKLLLRIKSSAVQTYSWNAIYRGSTDVVLPSASSGGGKTDYVGFVYNSADTKWDCVASVKGYT